MSADVRFKHPFICIIAGPAESGKSTFCVRFLQNLNSLCTEQLFNGGILWCFNERTSIPTGDLDGINLNIRYHEDLPMDFKSTRGEPCLFILDDLLNEAYSSVLVCDMLIIGSHHCNISVILITQKYSISPSVVATFH
jgi:hypothetical protein